MWLIKLGPFPPKARPSKPNGTQAQIRERPSSPQPGLLLASPYHARDQASCRLTGRLAFLLPRVRTSRAQRSHQPSLHGYSAGPPTHVAQHSSEPAWPPFLHISCCTNCAAPHACKPTLPVSPCRQGHANGSSLPIASYSPTGSQPPTRRPVADEPSSSGNWLPLQRTSRAAPAIHAT